MAPVFGYDHSPAARTYIGNISSDIVECSHLRLIIWQYIVYCQDEILNLLYPHTIIEL